MSNWHKEYWEKLEKNEVKQGKREVGMEDNAIVINFPSWEAKRDFVAGMDSWTWDHNTNSVYENYEYKNGKGLTFTLPEEGYKNYSKSALFEWVMNNQYQTEGYLNSAVGFSTEEVIEGS